MTAQSSTPIFRPRRTARVLGRFWSAALAAEMEYRANFAVAVATSTLGLGVGIFGVYLFYRGGYRFAGWSWDQALAVLGAFTFLQGFASTILVPNLSRIVRHVQEGTLDFVLLKPFSSQLWLSTRALSPWGLPDILLGTGLMAYSARGADAPLWGAAVAALALLIAAVCLYSLWFLLATTSIWFVKIYNVTEVLRGVLEAGRYPIDAFPAAYRLFLTFVVPVVFMTTIPAEALLGRVDWLALVGGVTVAGALLTGSILFWRFALRYYTSASS